MRSLLRRLRTAAPGRLLALALPLALAGTAASRIPWEDLTETDWGAALATRFASVDGQRVHYPTPTAELARLLEGRTEAAALRHLAEARAELGDRPGALAAMERWAAAQGPAAWAETARWAMARLETAAAFRAAERALPGLPPEERRALADERIRWAEAHPDAADALALRQARAELFPKDPAALEDWLRALEKAGRLQEADRALAASGALSPERSLLLRSDLLADHGDRKGALQVLDAAVAQPWSIDLRRAFAKRVAEAAPSSPAAWRSALEKGFDAAALVRLATLFQGQDRGEAATDLLRQVERRHEAGFSRADRLLVARLYQEVDAVPEAFRARLAAAHAGSASERRGDLAELARLALRAGGRPLALGTYNDEPYRWVARTDRTPGFWTGGVSFLLTGQDWNEALTRLETDAVPERTFALARTLVDELARQDSADAALPGLRVAVMERHVERGEGRAALALLPGLESGPAAEEARRVALLAMRQAAVPLDQEVRVMQARLRHAAPDGSRPGRPTAAAEEVPDAGGQGGRPWARPHREGAPRGYQDLLQECIARLDHRDPSHRASVALLLKELDRMPAAEELWLNLAARLEGWNLDDELGPRYEQALQRFQGPGLWARAARWYARRNRHAQLRGLAEDLARRFRGADIFARSDGAAGVRLEIPEQPPVGGRVRLVPWADWVRYKALERFPQSPRVYHEAQRLVTESRWRARPQDGRDGQGPVVVPDALVSTRRAALLFVDPAVREGWFAAAMRQGGLQGRLQALEARTDRSPVEDLLLFEGWARLSRFEQAAPAAERLAAVYPGDGALARRVLSLQRSLNGLDAARAGAARDLVARVAPALQDPAPLWTELGELEEERGHPAEALASWRRIVAREPRNPARISELATLMWDYGHDAEALAVVEEGRRQLARPRFFAFETGVLRENLKDADGAVREYLDALRPEQGDPAATFEQDQRSLRRLAQLLGRERVARLVERRIRGLRPGEVEDERTLSAFLPLATLVAPAPGLAWDADQWIDDLDLPNDPVARAARAERMAKERPAQYAGIARIGEVLLEKAQEMVPRATRAEFLASVRGWSEGYLETRWPKPRVLAFRNGLLARGAELAPDEGARIRLETARARFLAEQGLAAEAEAVWTALAPRLAALPEGAPRLRAEAERAAFLERARGVPAAAAEWRRLTERYPWSLGLLEDRLAFLQRTGAGEEARRLLEDAAPRAAAGHREALLERLAKDCLAASDLPRARRAVERWLAEAGLDGPRRLGAVHLLARLSWRESKAWDPKALVQAETARLRPEDHADLWQQLARAADLESVPALPLWIEALNRRTDRAWLDAACRSSERAGRAQELLAFFERQQQRSPRDVRWAVAVRDLRAALNQVDGALAAAKAAVAVRPERENLWREAADLLVRADRTREAADFLEGWNRPRPADEGVANLRSGLYARAGDGERALAVERAALDAYRRQAPEDREELAERRGRATLRLLEAGLPQMALRLHSATGDATALAGSKVPPDRQCELALLTGQFPRRLQRSLGEPEFRDAAAAALREKGRPEQSDEVLALALGQILPAAAAQPAPAALDRWWPFLAAAGLEPAARLGLAGGLAARRPGPWQAQAPAPFLRRAGADLLAPRAGQEGAVDFREPDWARLWALELARLDRGADLLAYLEPRWQDLLAQVKGPRALDGGSERLPWTGWLDDPKVLQVWARAAAGRPEKAREAGEVLGERRLWDRFWVLAARKWQAAPLLSVAEAGPRSAWFGFWEAGAGDPALAGRRRTTDQVTQALARLLQGAPGAAADPLIERLRGPRTVGEILGREARWTWPDFAPRKDARGEVLEKGVERAFGSGAETGRVPGALWGDRAAEAWLVLETLARYRQKDPEAPRVPLDLPQRGGENDRLLLALRLARGLGLPATALELDAARPPAAGDRRRMEARLQALVAAGRRPEALEAWRQFLRRGQGTLTEEEFRTQEALGEELALGPALEQLDPAQPVGPAFLAFLADRRPDRAPAFRTADPVGYRLALAARWRFRPRDLSAEQARVWLRELWVPGISPLPRPALARLGAHWPHAAEWLDRRPQEDRRAALEALQGALEGSGGSFPWPAARGGDEEVRLLALRLRLARRETAQALVLVDGLLEEMQAAEALGWPTPAADEAAFAGREGDEEEAPVQAPPMRLWEDPAAARLRIWLQAFRDAKQGPAVEERLRVVLRQRRALAAVPVPSWVLAVQVAPAAELPALEAELERAWFRGDLPAAQLGPLAQALAGPLPAAVPRWLARWTPARGFAAARLKATILAEAKMGGAVLAALEDPRSRGPWSLDAEVQAFDLWRQLGAPVAPGAKAPAPWAAALPLWTAPSGAPPAGLGARLRAQPQDVLSARAVLRSPVGLDEDTLARAATALEGRTGPEDRLLLRLRATRGLLAGSWRAAAESAGPEPPEEVLRVLVSRRLRSADLNAALADLARISARLGQEVRTRGFLAALAERRAPGLPALRAELARSGPERPEPWRQVDGRPAPLRPRDLTWALLGQVLTSEGVR